MTTKSSFAAMAVLCLIVADPVPLSADEEQVLFDFGKPAAAQQWQTVNDGVMGGVSDGQVKIANETMVFFGTLSLENNGGFASVRSKAVDLDLQKGDTISARVRGDGRQYDLNLYVPRRSGGYSFRHSFKTEKDKWIEVSFPVDSFVATYRGRVFPEQRFDPSEVNALGFLLADKKAGPFKLEVEWIRFDRGNPALAGDVASPTHVPYDTYSGYFVSNEFEPDTRQSFVVLASQDRFDKVFGVAFVMGDKAHRLPKQAFKSLMVLSVVKRGNALVEYKVEDVTVEHGVVHLRYKTASKATPETTFACPLIVSVPMDKYEAVVFVEDGKKLKAVKLSDENPKVSP